MQPIVNSWEPRTQQTYTGVSNGLRNSVLYMLDQKSPKYKKYHIPAPNNPFYDYQQYRDDLVRLGGEQSDDFQRSVLGRHGSAALQLIPRDSIHTETFSFYNYNYTSSNVQKGESYKTMLETPTISADAIIMAIDPGFVDTCVIQMFTQSKDHVWRLVLRYQLSRIDFQLQEEIIDWLATYYNVNKISIDIGAGGNGAGIMHNLMYRDDYKSKNYNERIVGVQMKQHVTAGYDENENEITQESKAVAAEELVKRIQAGLIRISEVDFETLSQLERVAKQKRSDGKDSYFIMSDKGHGKSNDDHIFASFLCFAFLVRDEVFLPNIITKLGKSRGIYT